MRIQRQLWFVRAAGLAASIAILSGCATPSAAICSPGLGSPLLVFDLFFGSSIPGRGDLTAAEWQSFRDDAITANLPNGYTVLEAAGGWMNPMTHETISEASRVVIVALPESPDSLGAVNRIRTGYQVRFHQQLVGMTVTRACGSF